MRSLLIVAVAALAAMSCGGGGDRTPASTPTAPTAITQAPPSSPTPARATPITPEVRPTPAALTVTVPTPTATPAPVPIPVQRVLAGAFRVEQAYPRISYSRMIALAFADDVSGTAFLVLQPGQIMSFDASDENGEATELLDIRDRVKDRGNEEGLLGLALGPDFQRTGYLFVYYTASDPNRGVLSRFTVEPDGLSADPDSELVVLEVDQPYQNHNGGQVLFGPDGYLYLGLGDAGSRGDPRGNGQDPATHLGTILRFDVASLDSTGSYTIPGDNPFIELSNARGEI